MDDPSSRLSIYTSLTKEVMTLCGGWTKACLNVSRYFLSSDTTRYRLIICLTHLASRYIPYHPSQITI